MELNLIQVIQKYLWILPVALVLAYIYRAKLVHEWQFALAEPRRWLFEKWKNWGEPLLIAAILAIFIRTFIFGPYKIPTGSMKPTFMEEDKIFVDKLSYRFHEPQRGDIIVFKYPRDPKKDFVKRLAGLPGKPNFYTFPPRGIGGMILKDNRMIPMSELSHPEEPYRGRTEDRKQETLEPRTPPAGTGV